MDYRKLTKAQLIERIHELETQTVEYKWEHFVAELKLLITDLKNLVGFIYVAGVKTRLAYERLTESTMEIPEMVILPVEKEIAASGLIEGGQEKELVFDY